MYVIIHKPSGLFCKRKGRDFETPDMVPVNWTDSLDKAILHKTKYYHFGNLDLSYKEVTVKLK